MKGRTACIALAAVVAGLGAPAAARSGPPLQLEQARKAGERAIDLRLRTRYVDGPTGVRVLLPRGYAGSGRRYPVLYLLHGAVGSYRSWTELGDAERITRVRQLIVVMPDSGPGGGYTDWWNGGRRGRPAWERYHIGQLIPFIDRRYRTRADRSGRALAGLSMGGFGAMTYAARHPDLFTAAASFSGAVDLTHPGIVAVTGDRPFGPFATQELRWRARNPVDLAANLRGLDVTIRAGDGMPGGALGGDAFDPIESVTYQASRALHRRLERLSIPHRWDYYGPGNHTWPYWRRGLRQTLPALMRRFERRPAPPPRVRFSAAEPSYGAYGWHVTRRRPTLEFSTLSRADRNGFHLTGSGSGSAVVSTPAAYRPCATHRAEIADGAGRRELPLEAGRGGRLRVELDLGPAGARRSDTASVRIRPDAGGGCARRR